MSDAAFVGIDVGKDYLDVAFSGEPKARRFCNNDAGIAELIALMRERPSSSRSWKQAEATNA
jgi:transposase